jgi:UDP-glucose 4-epimerase
MSLEDSIDLVTHAFEHGKQGDILVQKTPAATIGDLAKCLKELFKVKNKIVIIGTRHGEKLYETLLSREEMFVSENNGRFYRIPMDNRDLNYDKYFSNGKKNISLCNDYTSHNADRLNIKELKKIILKLNDIKKVIND